MFGGDAEQDAGGNSRLATALFPVAERGWADAKGGRELRLAEVELGADGGDGLSRRNSVGGGVSRQSDGTFRCFIPSEIPSGYSLVIHHRSLLAILSRYFASNCISTARGRYDRRGRRLFLFPRR